MTSSIERPIAIAIAGLGCETSTFTPSRTEAAAFHIHRGPEILDFYHFLNEATSLRNAAKWQGALIGHALPGGIITRDTFEQLSREILNRLTDIVATERLDGMWYDIHGAMVVEGLDDAESELLRRIRKVIGPDVAVSASMDLHGNVSRELVHRTDLITCYRMAPHEDDLETKERACRKLVELLQDQKVRKRRGIPLKAWIPLPVLLPGEQTSTRLEPAKSLYAAVPNVEATPGVIDAGIWIGYAWADQPRDRAVVVVTGWDENAVASGAEKLARKFWSVHKDFKFVAPTGTLADCVEAALASNERPYFISDSGDNPTAGGSGDVTWTLHQLLSHPAFQSPSSPRLVYASLPIGAKAIKLCVDAGIGAHIALEGVGAGIDRIHCGPVDLQGHIHAIKQGDEDAKTEVVVRTHGNIFVILTELRKPYHKEQDFTDLNLDIRDAKGVDMVVVKIGYLEPELYEMAKGWMLALTPGGVDQHLERLGHKRVRRPMWPFDKDFAVEPDLRARMINASSEPLSGPDE
jgi:microcystin degradation protein MlrC